MPHMSLAKSSSFLLHQPSATRRVRAAAPCRSSGRLIDCGQLKVSSPSSAAPTSPKTKLHDTYSRMNKAKIGVLRTWRQSLPVTPLAHSNPESMHGRYAVYDQVTSMKRERTLPIRRTRSVPTLIDNDGNVKPSGLIRVIPTPSRGDTKSLDMMHASKTSNLNC
ncbi:hypothetical protein F2Q68_00023553 [Brassica cretica]|uniref:Uncharacterized protein n=2 Tax=Brassica cretica TaxID=69181 RepID=A0A8S9FVL3_BRACR|nr:hypothetical protein F2Q68_00023553 [Brassica cretica]KAF3568200.1 hypothetical protein DY000_02019956 [Brassica cretica]